MIIGLLGFGTVGSGVYETVKKRFPNFKIKKILVRHMRNRDDKLFTTDPDEIFGDGEIDVIVDALGNLKSSEEMVVRAIECKKNVVTSNKELVSFKLPELMELAKKNGVSVLYESTVGAGLPWIKTLQDYRKINVIDEVYGNFNGTSNFILDLMRKDGIDFEEALIKSRMLRYQEPNYRDDITGIDSRNKLAITVMLAFGSYINPDEIPTYGIETIRNLDFGFFERHRLVPKLMSYAYRRDGRLAMLVAPTLYRHDRPRANVSGNNNMLGFVGDVVGRVEFIGQGAGKFSAANGVILDLLALESDNPTEAFTLKPAKVDETIMNYKFYFSFDRTSHKIERILSPYVYSIFETNDSCIITTRNIGLDTCIELLWKIECTNERFFFAVYEDSEGIKEEK